ncbi:MAG: twin-arginine translocase subunit TatB [Aquificae bacterium]|nr:twin-arginine translocase subunit TatB [Aquificota bacterium]
MFGIGLAELIVIFIVALLVLGPKRLPEVARTLGKFYREIKSTIDEVKDVVAEEPKPKRQYPPVEERLSRLDELEEKETEKENKEEKPEREKISFKKKAGEKA